MYCKLKVVEEPEEINLIKCYNVLIKKLEDFPSDNEFTIRDLFDNEMAQWDDLSQGIKVALGRYFYSNIKNRKDIEILGYGTGKIMKYCKKY